MAERALILSADVWSMKDEQSGKPLSGVSVWYVNDYREDADDSFGFKPTKVSGTQEILSELRGKTPGVFEVSFGSRPGAQNKAQLTLVGVKHVAAVDLFAEHTAFSPAPKSLETKQAEKF
ncbi:hypothetical protein [Aeromonas veronii]|uniref:hypothetical protein n=1 Tax=Aeromonas veronii TaxID=654 RepID=UPI003BA3BCC2